MIRRLYEVEDRARPLDNAIAHRDLPGPAEVVPIFSWLSRAGPALGEAAAQIGVGQGDDICVQPVQAIVPLHGRWRVDDGRRHWRATGAGSCRLVARLVIPGE